MEYEIESLVAHGGMSAVYRASGPDGTVALKVLTVDDPEVRERFRNELAVSRSFDHPGLLGAHESGEDRGVPWLALPWVDGVDLRRIAPLSPPRAARAVADVGEALDALHAAGFVHRDVKPGNVLVGADRAYLTDFGLAKPIDDDPGLTAAGRWLGTADFAAPEQIRGGAAGVASDVYALGGVLFWAVTGRVPYPTDSDEETMRAHLREAPPALDGPLGAVVQRAMRKVPAERYESAGSLGRAALAATGSTPI